MKATKYKCSSCGKLTSGRLPTKHRQKGDGSFMFPRRHASIQGDPCPGIYEEATWVDVEILDR